MERDLEGKADSAQFEWVNDWAAGSNPPAAAPAPETIAAEIAVEPPIVVRRMPTLPSDQLMRDIAEIERVRDRLAAIPDAARTRRPQALTLVPSRTTDSVPVMIGGVLALVMLAVFGAAAAMSKLSR